MLAATGKASPLRRGQVRRLPRRHDDRQGPRRVHRRAAAHSRLRREPRPRGQAGRIGSPGASRRPSRCRSSSKASLTYWKSAASLKSGAARKGEEEQQGFAHTLDRLPAKPLDPSESRKGFAHILDDPREAQRAAREGGAARPQARKAHASEPGHEHIDRRCAGSPADPRSGVRGTGPASPAKSLALSGSRERSCSTLKIAPSDFFTPFISGFGFPSLCGPAQLPGQREDLPGPVVGPTYGHGIPDAAKLPQTWPTRGVDDVAFDVFDRLGTSDFRAFGAQYPCPHAPLSRLQP